MEKLIRIVKAFWREAPANIPREYRQGYFLSFYGILLAMSLHACWLFTFIKLGVITLWIVNIFSVLLFVSAVLLVRFRGMNAFGNIISSIEVLLHQAIAVYVLGWGYGFQYFYITIPMYIFLNLHRRFVIPTVTVVLTLLAYIALYYFAQRHAPLVRLPSMIQDLFFISNISATIILVALFSLIYSRAAYANNRALERARQISDENMRRAQELLSIVSHDIANSIFIASASLQVMNKKKLLNSEVAQTWAQRLGLGIRNIQDIVDSVCMLRSIEDGKQEFALQPVDVGAILEKTRQTFLEKLEEKGVKLELCCPPNDCLRVMAEPVTLYNNVFCNLVSNALKFSFPQSMIRIAAGREDGYVKITVTDSGIGIPSELLERLFSFGEKTSRPGTAGEKGTGYGMPVVKRFIDLYNGQIAVSSITHEQDETRHGTTFELRLQAA